MPSLRSAVNFVGYAGPIAGVLVTKVIIYGELSFPSAPTAMRCQHSELNLF
jgi:hypothetical protein